MTTITIYNDKLGEYKRFVCMGHAGFAKKGSPDILCASISMLVIGTINSLTELAHEDIHVTTNEETGFIDCEFKGKLQDKSRFLVDSMIFNLKELSKEYGKKYLLVKFEEV